MYIKRKVYVETSVISYLTARPSPDAIKAACQQITRQWWDGTWNCTHIANPIQLPVMRGLCAARGYKLPELVTPFELMETIQ
jgi:hypothetical protein